MKQIKKILITLVCVLCVCLTFSLASCTDGSYIEGSFTYSIDSSYNYFYYVNGEFKIKPSKSGKYEVRYTITTEGDRGTQIKTDSQIVTATKNEEKTIAFRLEFSKFDSKYNNEASISNIHINLLAVDDDDVGDKAYAIGFGVAGGAVLICAVILFVLDKTGKLNKQK